MNNEALYQMELALQQIMQTMLGLVQIVVSLQKALTPEEVDESEYYGAGNYNLLGEGGEGGGE